MLGLQDLSPQESAKLAAATARSMAMPLPFGDEQTLLREAISDLEGAALQQPREWLFQYKLNDFFLRTKQYVKAVYAGEQALALNEKDPRPHYALATTYRTLARARYAGPAFSARLATPTGRALIAAGYDPEPSRQALVELKMTCDEAARRAIQLFADTLQFEMPLQERKFVREGCFKEMLGEFKHLSNLPKLPAERPWWKVW